MRDADRQPSRSTPLRRGVLLLVLAALFAGLLALGDWQLARRAWKLELIERVERHLLAAAVPAPGPAQWSTVGRDDEYRRVTVTGRFAHDRETCTQAVTVRGPGCWVLTPLRTDAGDWILVNRGFVDPAHRDPATRGPGQVEGPTTLVGLLRLSEPGGGFLRANDPAIGRWTSRDVVAIARARGLTADRVAPYFIDASATETGGPIGGMTVVQFRNSHLVYALTWYALALLAALGAIRIWRRDRRIDGLD